MSLFIMIPISLELRQCLENNNDLFKGSYFSGKYVKGDDYHITLKYFGKVNKTKIPIICQAIEDSALRCAPFTLKIKQGDMFDKDKRRRILIYTLAGQLNKLVALRNSLEGALFLRGFKRDSLEFIPHITIARKIGYGEMPEIDIPYDAINVSSIVLMETMQNGTKTKYVQIGEFHFQGGDLFVESIDEDIVLCENSNGDKIHLSKEELSSDIIEGSVIVRSGSTYILDETKTQIRQHDIDAKLQQLIDGEHL